MQQAQDFKAECDQLHDLLAPCDDAVFQWETQFKGWTINDVIGHLHMFNVAARYALEDEARFDDFIAPVVADLKQGKPMLASQYVWLNGLEGRALFDDVYGGPWPGDDAEHFTPQQIANIKNAYRIVYRKGLKLADAIAEIEALVEEQPELELFARSLHTSERGLLR